MGNKDHDINNSDNDSDDDDDDGDKKYNAYDDNIHCVPKKSDAKIEITITTSNLIRIKHPFSNFN